MITTILNTIPDEPFIVSIVLLHIKAFIVLSAAYIAAESLWRYSASQRFAILACGFCAIACMPLFNSLTGFDWRPQISIQRTVSIETLYSAELDQGAKVLSSHQIFFILYALGVLWHLLKLSISLGSVLVILRHNRKAQYNDKTYYLNRKIAAPFSFGAISPVIVLPHKARFWSESMLQAVLAHEQAHCRRRDWLIFLLAKLICAVFWLAPWVWQAERKLRRLAEHACDDAALRSIAFGDEVNSELNSTNSSAVYSAMGNTHYASLLLETAGKRSGLLQASAVPAFHGSELRLRIEHVLQDDLSRQPLTRPFALTSIASFVLLTLLLSSFKAQAAWQTNYDRGLAIIGQGLMETALKNSNSPLRDPVTESLPEVTRPERPEKNKAAMELPELTNAVELNNPRKIAIKLSAPEIEKISLDSNVAVQGRMPRVMASVDYPKAAQRHGIEGYVIVRFTIDEQGRVINPSILQAEPKNIFDSSALRAIKQFQYTPLEIGGVPTPIDGVLNRFIFQLSDKPIKTPKRSIPFSGTTLIALQDSS